MKAQVVVSDRILQEYCKVYRYSIVEILTTTTYRAPKRRPEETHHIVKTKLGDRIMMKDSELKIISDSSAKICPDGEQPTTEVEPNNSGDAPNV